MSGPLEGLKVIDLTAALAGPFCTMILSDLGATVIKVEPPGGEVTRRVGPWREEPSEGYERLGGYFQSINRGKQSIVLDLKKPDDYATLLAMVAEAEVIVQNFGPGVAERLGLGFDRLKTVNPRIVYGTLSGFGSAWAGASPYAHWPAMDVTIQAMAGPLSMTGTEDGQPIKVGPGIGDIFPGTLLAVGLLAALRHADRTGEGQEVDIAMYDAILSLCERLVYQYSYTGHVSRPLGNTHPILTPFDVLPARDGWIAIAATTQGRWEALCTIMARPDMITDPRFVSEGQRTLHRDVIRATLAAWVAERTRDELSEALGGRVPYGPVNDAKDIFSDEHAVSRHMLVEVESPGSSTPAVIAGQPLKFSGTPARLDKRAPLLDEHGAAIRAALAADPPS